MDDKLNRILVLEILNHIQSHIKPIDYLMDVLNVSKESIYRRMRGQIPFSFEEICKLSLKLGFSIDSIIGQSKDNRIYFDLQADQSVSPAKAFQVMLEQYYEHTIKLSNAQNVESIMALNHMPPIFSVFFDDIFKFMYYKWVHRNHEGKYYYSDLVVPDKIKSLQEKIKNSIVLNKNNTFLFDPNVFLSMIKDVQYYYKRKLINNEELLAIKKDIGNLIDMVQDLVHSGALGTDSRCFFFISEVNIEANSSYITYDDNTISHFFVYTANPIIIINNPELNAVHKKWLDSIKKYSTLITQSNERLQAEYFNKQYGYLEDIAVI